MNHDQFRLIEGGLSADNSEQPANESNRPQVFQFDDHPIRVFDRDGQPWLAASDVCRALGLANTKCTLRRLEGRDVALIYLGRLKLFIINEAGLRRLTSTTRKKPAGRLWNWAVVVALPASRQREESELKGAKHPAAPGAISPELRSHINSRAHSVAQEHCRPIIRDMITNAVLAELGRGLPEGTAHGYVDACGDLFGDAAIQRLEQRLNRMSNASRAMARRVRTLCD